MKNENNSQTQHTPKPDAHEPEEVPPFEEHSELKNNFQKIQKL